MYRLLTVLDVADVADDEVADRDVNELAGADSREAVLVLDAVLQSAELALLLPVVERRHEHDHQHGHQDRHALDPRRLRLGLVRPTDALGRCTSQHRPQRPSTD